MSGKLIDLKRRISSIKSTQKITKAMKSVSASKLKKAVNQLNNNKFYMEEMKKIIYHISKNIDKYDYPLFNKKETGKKVLVFISSDKGLCGSFNSKLFEKFENYYNKEAGDEIITIGKKISQYLTKKNITVTKSFNSIMSMVTFEESLNIIELLKKKYSYEDFKSIEIIYTNYESAGSQKIIEYPFFPMFFEIENNYSTDIDFIFEPEPKIIFDALIDNYINAKFYRLLLESCASENTTRMIAMDMATNNAKDILKDLTLQLNNLRQESITTELLEIISVTEAMNN